MLGLPRRIVQAYHTVLLQYKKAEGFTLGSKGIRHRKNKKAQGKQALDPFRQLGPSKPIPRYLLSYSRQFPALKWASRTSWSATTAEISCQTHGSLSKVLPRRH